MPVEHVHLHSLILKKPQKQPAHTVLSTEWSITV